MKLSTHITNSKSFTVLEVVFIVVISTVLSALLLVEYNKVVMKANLIETLIVAKEVRGELDALAQRGEGLSTDKNAQINTIVHPIDIELFAKQFNLSMPSPSQNFQYRIKRDASFDYHLMAIDREYPWVLLYTVIFRPDSTIKKVEPNPSHIWVRYLGEKYFVSMFPKEGVW